MEERIAAFCGQWTVPVVSSSPPGFLHLSPISDRPLCAVCLKKKSSIRVAQLVIFRDYVGTGVSVAFINHGAISHYERAPSYTMVLPKMCGACEDNVVDYIAAQNYQRAFYVDAIILEPYLIAPLIHIINDYMKLDNPFLN